MLSLVLLATLAQADAPLTEPPPPPPVVMEQPPRAVTPTQVRHSATLFSSRQVDGGTLVARMALGFLGEVGGGTISAAIMGFALLASGGNSTTALLIAAPFALAALGFGTALGTAAFGDNYADDLADAVIVSMATSLIATAAVLVGIFVLVEAVIPIIIVASFFPAVATPLFVQAFKKPADPGVVVARF